MKELIILFAGNTLRLYFGGHPAAQIEVLEHCIRHQEQGRAVTMRFDAEGQMFTFRTDRLIGYHLRDYVPPEQMPQAEFKEYLRLAMNEMRKGDEWRE